MIVKLLNGDLLCLDAENERDIIEQVSKVLAVPSFNVEIHKYVSSSEFSESDEKTESIDYVAVTRTAALAIDTSKIRAMCSYTIIEKRIPEKYISTCVNPDMIRYLVTLLTPACVQSVGIHYYIAKNPHHDIVERVIELIREKENENIFPTFSANPSEKAVEFLIAHPHLIHWQWFSYNKNRKAILYAMEHGSYNVLRGDDHNQFNLCSLLQNPYRDVLDFVLTKSHYDGDKIFWGVNSMKEPFLQACERIERIEEDTEEYAQLSHYVARARTVFEQQHRICPMWEFYASSNVPEWLEQFLHYFHTLTDTQRMGLDAFMSNPHPIAVDWVLNNVRIYGVHVNGWKLPGCEATYMYIPAAVYRNPNPRIVERLLKVNDRSFNNLRVPFVNTNEKMIEVDKMLLKTRAVSMNGSNMSNLLESRELCHFILSEPECKYVVDMLYPHQQLMCVSKIDDIDVCFT